MDGTKEWNARLAESWAFRVRALARIWFSEASCAADGDVQPWSADSARDAEALEALRLLLHRYGEENKLPGWSPANLNKIFTGAPRAKAPPNVRDGCLAASWEPHLRKALSKGLRKDDLGKRQTKKWENSLVMVEGSDRLGGVGRVKNLDELDSAVGLLFRPEAAEHSRGPLSAAFWSYWTGRPSLAVAESVRAQKAATDLVRQAEDPSAGAQLDVETRQQLAEISAQLVLIADRLRQLDAAVLGRLVPGAGAALGPLFDFVQGLVHDALRHGLLAVLHHAVDKTRQYLAAVTRVGLQLLLCSGDSS